MPLEGIDGDWKPVKRLGIAEGYQVSLYGELRSPRGRLVKPQHVRGKVVVALKLANSANSTTAHLARLVLSAFDHPEPDLVPDYIDGDFTNCQLINLRWREPTIFEIRAKKAMAVARKTKKKGASKSRVAPAAPRMAAEVEVMRVYKHGGLTIPVSPDGEIPAKALPQGKLSAQKVASLAKILAMVVEMNTLMGLGK